MIEDAAFYLRNPDLIAIGTSGHCLFVEASGRSFGLPTPCVQLWSALLQELADPVPGDRFRRRLDELPLADARFVEHMLEAGLLVQDRDPEALRTARNRVLVDNGGYHFEPREPRCAHLLVALTGSIVAGLMPPVVLSLAYSRFQGQLDVLLTRTSLQFTTRDLFESYGIRTWVDPFERRDGINVAHVSLGSSASCVLVMPASANALHRLADTACTDLLSMTVAATRAPVVLAPVMNNVMWNNPGVQRHVQRLREDGMYVIEPTIIVKAANFTQQCEPTYGGPGPFWRGALGVMQCLSAVLDHAASRAPDHRRDLMHPAGWGGGQAC